MKSAWAFCGVALLVVAQMLLADRLRAIEPAWVAPPHEQQQKWDPQIFRVLTFGHLPSAVDALWIRVVSDPSLAHVPEGVHAPIFYDLDLASDLDPENFILYSSGSYLLTIVRDDDEGARDILVKGIDFFKTKLNQYPREFRSRYWSTAFTLYLTLAYVYLYELNDMPKASAVFREASSIPGAPAYLKALKEKLERPDGEYEVALRLVEFLITEQRDEEARAKLESKRKSLYLSLLIRSLNRKFGEWNSQKRQQRGGTLNQLWDRFRSEKKVPLLDPWGGSIELNPDGKITTTTPREKVFGLD